MSAHPTNESGEATVTLSLAVLRKLLGLDKDKAPMDDDGWDDDSYFGGGPDWSKL